MNKPMQGRMLLSHNFNISSEVVPALSRPEFTAVFKEGLGEQIHCRMLDHPHWMVELLFPTDLLTANQVGEHCAQALASKRINPNGHLEILILGGLKTTPPTSNAPDALQPGQWGVDVVETSSGQEFLQSINWENTIATKPTTEVFCVQFLCSR